MRSVDGIEERQDLPRAETEQVIRELESHYQESQEEWIPSGMNECESATEAARRIGDSIGVAHHIQSTHDL